VPNCFRIRAPNLPCSLHAPEAHFHQHITIKNAKAIILQ